MALATTDILGSLGSLFAGGLGGQGADTQAAAIRAGGQQGQQTLAPFIGGGIQANNALLGGLGQQGAPGQAQQFQNFLNSNGFKEQLRAGSEAITGNQAAAGLLNSGATLKRLNTFGQQLGQQGFNNFLGQLQSVAQRGVAPAQQSAVIANASGTNAANAAATGAQARQSGLSDAISLLLG